MKTNWIGISLLAFGVSAAGVVAVSAQPRGGGGGGQRGQGPTPAMLQACEAKQSGDTCSSSEENGNAISGSCFAPRGLPLACVPNGGAGGGREGGGGDGGPGGGGPPPSESNTGTAIPNGAAYTLGVKCDVSHDAINPQIGLVSQSLWDCIRGQRVLTANGVPDHTVGTFPNPANPNTISAQTVTFAVTTNPIALSGPGGRVKEPVMGLNGIKFDPGTGGACSDDVTDPNECPLGPGGGGTWNIEALGQDIFDFGEDDSNAHVQPGGTYHYHGVPYGMLSAKAAAGEEMQMIGWASDGFPVYARYGFPRPGLMMGDLKMMQPSYRLKAEPDAGRPAVAIVPMGTFQQDWEYVEGLGDLDQCNGRYGSTPEFPEGIYHYYATDAYPYIQRCVKGTIDSEPRIERRGGEGRQRRGRGRGERGGRGGGGERGGGGQRPGQ